MMMKNSTNTDITINTVDIHQAQHIKRYDINDAHKYLGINTAPNGNKTDTINVLKQICSTFAQKYSHAIITADEAYLALIT